MIWTGSAGQGGGPRTNVPSADHPCYSPPQSHPSFSTMPVRRSGIGWPIQPNADCVDLLWNATSQDQSHQNAINPCSPLILKIWPNYCAFTGGDAELHSLETIVTDILNFEKPESETPTNILAERSSDRRDATVAMRSRISSVWDYSITAENPTPPSTTMS